MYINSQYNFYTLTGTVHNTRRFWTFFDPHAPPSSLSTQLTNPYLPALTYPFPDPPGKYTSFMHGPISDYRIVLTTESTEILHILIAVVWQQYASLLIKTCR